MKLKVYLAEVGMTFKELAEELEIAPSYLRSIGTGKLFPSAKLARHITAATEGKVTFDRPPK